jgi:hypothetical protein
LAAFRGIWRSNEVAGGHAQAGVSGAVAGRSGREYGDGGDLRIAVDLKVELFRNPVKPWSMNAIYRASPGRPGRPDRLPSCEQPADERR